MSLYFWIIIGFLLASYFLDSLILLLNIKKQPKTIPALLDNLMKDEDYKQNLSYNKDRSTFSFAQSTFSWSYYYPLFFWVVSALLINGPVLLTSP